MSEKTEQFELIRHSITKPVFKDKIRLRSYNIPTKNSDIYLEIKRKYDGFGAYITPSMDEVDALVEIGVEVIAVDATELTHPGNISSSEFI